MNVESVNLDVVEREVVENGFAVIPSQVPRAHVDQLNDAADTALSAVREALAAGVRPSHTELNEFVHAARCFYSWSDAARQLLAHDTIDAVGKRLLGHPRLWDMTVLEATPLPADGQLGAFDWHRDFADVITRDRPNYLWIFTCLTDVTGDNGATWVIPTSHRDRTIPTPAPGAVSANRPSSAVQLTASAGDMVVLDPTALHAVGENSTDRGRRLALVALCGPQRSPLLDHWRIAEQVIADNSSERISDLLRPSDASLDGTWDVLPAGWGTGTRHRDGTVLRALKKVKRTLQAASPGGRV